MSIEKTNSGFKMVCDNCLTTLPGDHYTFDEVITAKKLNGWKSKKFNGEWEDWCDLCYEEAGE